MQAVRDQIQAIEEIGTLPSTLARVFSIVQDDGTTAIDLASEIASDQALAMRVLRTVNSSYYGFSRNVQSISEAVVILGFNEVERLALAISVIKMFGRDPESIRALQKLWRHSLNCSVAAGMMEQHFRSEWPEVSGLHLAGLLHDIGKAVIAQHLPEEMSRIVHLVHDTGCTSYEAEYEVLGGITHCEIGAWVAERWGLSADLVESIARHHEPDAAAPDHVLTHATHLANVICNTLEATHGEARLAEMYPNPISLRLLPLDEGLVRRVGDQIEKQRGLFGAVAIGAMP